MSECRNPIHCLSKFDRISHASTLSAEVHHRRVEEREREREGCVCGGGIRELASERKGQRETEREKERGRDRVYNIPECFKPKEQSMYVKVYADIARFHAVLGRGMVRER